MGPNNDNNLEERVNSGFGSFMKSLLPQPVNKAIVVALVLLSLYAYSGVKELKTKITRYTNESKNYSTYIGNENYFLNLLTDENWENEKAVLNYILKKSESEEKSLTLTNYMLGKTKSLDMFFTPPFKINDFYADMPKPDSVLWLNTKSGFKWVLLYFPDKDNMYNTPGVMDTLNIMDTSDYHSFYAIGKTSHPYIVIPEDLTQPEAVEVFKKSVEDIRTFYNSH